MKKLGLGLLFVLLLTVPVSYVFAATYYSYNVTAPKLGGTGYTENKTKKAAGNYIITGKNGDNRTLRVRLETHNGNFLSDWMDFPSDSRLQLPNTGSANQSVRVALKTRLTSPVAIQSIGTWSPEP